MNLEDAKLYAEAIVQDAAKVVGKLSVPAERALNLAKCFLRLNDPVCCHAKEQCEACPMKRWEIKANSWMNPLNGQSGFIHNKPKNKAKPGAKPIGRPGRAVLVGEQRYRSVAAAAKDLGVHKAVVNRMIRDGDARFEA